jgi:hypothetical protein
MSARQGDAGNKLLLNPVAVISRLFNDDPDLDPCELRKALPDV